MRDSIESEDDDLEIIQLDLNRSTRFFEESKMDVRHPPNPEDNPQDSKQRCPGLPGNVLLPRNELHCHIFVQNLPG